MFCVAEYPRMRPLFHVLVTGKLAVLLKRTKHARIGRSLIRAVQRILQHLEIQLPRRPQGNGQENVRTIRQFLILECTVSLLSQPQYRHYFQFE